MGNWNALAVTHRFLQKYVPKGGFAIDATAGNGGDTLLLCQLVGENGHVLALDVQPQAVENTQKRLAEAGVAHLANVLCDSHANLFHHVRPESADCVVFNFGWLPGGDHEVFTRKETSIPAIQQALDCLKPGGILSLCLYYGRNNGYEERDAVLDYVKGLDHRRYTALVVYFANRVNDPPIPIFVIKEG